MKFQTILIIPPPSSLSPRFTERGDKWLESDYTKNANHIGQSVVDWGQYTQLSHLSHTIPSMGRCDFYRSNDVFCKSRWDEIEHLVAAVCSPALEQVTRVIFSPWKVMACRLVGTMKYAIVQWPDGSWFYRQLPSNNPRTIGAGVAVAYYYQTTINLLVHIHLYEVALSGNALHMDGATTAGPGRMPSRRLWGAAPDETFFRTAEMETRLRVAGIRPADTAHQI